MSIFKVPIIHVVNDTLTFVVGWVVLLVFDICCWAFVGLSFGQGLLYLTNHADFREKRVFTK